MTSFESWIFEYLWCRFHHFLSPGFHFQDLVGKARTDTDEKNGRKTDVLSCWLLLLYKGLHCSWKICLWDTPWHAALSQSSALSKVTFQAAEAFLRRAIQSDIQDNRGKCGQTKNVTKSYWLMQTDSRVNLQEIADCLGIDLSSASKTLNKRLGYRRMGARWIPHDVVTPENKMNRLQH